MDIIYKIALSGKLFFNDGDINERHLQDPPIWQVFCQWWWQSITSFTRLPCQESFFSVVVKWQTSLSRLLSSAGCFSKVVLGNKPWACLNRVVKNSYIGVNPLTLKLDVGFGRKCKKTSIPCPVWLKDTDLKDSGVAGLKTSHVIKNLVDQIRPARLVPQSTLHARFMGLTEWLSPAIVKHVSSLHARNA